MSGIVGGAGSRSGVIGPKTFTDSIYFVAYGGSGSTAIANQATVPFTTIVQNGTGMHATSGVFTCPVAGNYLFSAQVTAVSNTTNYVFKIVSSSVGYIARMTNGFDTQKLSENDIQVLVGTAKLSAGETVSLVNDVGASRNIHINLLTHTVFRGVLLR